MQRFKEIHASHQTLAIPPKPVGGNLPDPLLNSIASSPLTVLHVATLAALLPIPPSFLLFSPSRPLSFLSSFFALRPPSLRNLIFSSISLAMSSGRLEPMINGRGDRFFNGELVEYGSQRRKTIAVFDWVPLNSVLKRKTLLEWLLLENRFLCYQLTMMALNAGMEWILPTQSMASLLPSITRSDVWLMALLTPEDSTWFYGIPIHPMLMPIVTMLISGDIDASGWVRSLVTSILTCALWRTKRSDGELVVKWIHTGLLISLTNWWRDFSRLL